MYKISAFPLIAGTIIVYDQQSTNNTLLGTLVDANDDKKMVLLGIIGSVFRQCWSNVGVNFFFFWVRSWSDPSSVTATTTHAEDQEQSRDAQL